MINEYIKIEKQRLQEFNKLCIKNQQDINEMINIKNEYNILFETIYKKFYNEFNNFIKSKGYIKLDNMSNQLHINSRDYYND